MNTAPLRSRFCGGAPIQKQGLVQGEGRGFQVEREDAAIQNVHAAVVLATSGRSGETARFSFDLAGLHDPFGRESVILE